MTEKPDAERVARWPDELACLTGVADHQHTEKCLLYCYRCARQVASAEQIRAYASRQVRDKLVEMAGKIRVTVEPMMSKACSTNELGSAAYHEGKASAYREAADLLTREAQALEGE